MPIKNIFITIILLIVLLFFYQNCGHSTDKVPVTDGKIVIDDFSIEEEDCSSESFCKVIVKNFALDYPGVEYDFVPNVSARFGKAVPARFIKQNSDDNSLYECEIENQLDKRTFEYICIK